nr:MAG TPA: hypothetical protein [Caudoviricetes sp.]
MGFFLTYHQRIAVIMLGNAQAIPKTNARITTQ